jgi:hypothetical protein
VEPRLLPGRTRRSTGTPNRRPPRAPTPSGGPRTYSQPDAGSLLRWVGSACNRMTDTVVEIVAPGSTFDSTRGFPGEGPTGPTQTPWFLEDTSMQHLRDRKRRGTSFSGVPLVTRTEGRRLAFDNSPTLRRCPRSGDGARRYADTAMGRFLQSRARCGDGKSPTKRDDTPVPRELSAQVPAFSTPREQRDFLTPLPLVSADRSLRQEFIKHFGGLRGMDSASFDEIWKVNKNGYNKAHDPHFLRFRADFLTHSPSIRFNPTGIQPGDLVGFLRREHERGAAHPSLKDAAASVSTPCAQASDGLAQLGSQASVVSFLKYVKQHEAPDRRERMIVYPDIARLI